MVHVENQQRETIGWYVTNGASVVGPVDTDLLLRGITSARISDDCMVIQKSWSSWRSLREIREVSRISRPFSWNGSDRTSARSVPKELVQKAPDAGESLLFALQAAVVATRAQAGLVHRVRTPFVGLITSSVHGPGMVENLGQVVSRQDAAFDRACRGETLMGSAGDDDDALRAVARRFSAQASVHGVAMVPIFDGGRLLAMLELARTDHGFRCQDTAALAKIADWVSAR